jgi:exopolysaccharide biosynthesis WecB/TagA/CpsF family protein
MSRILVVQLADIGDLVLSTPALAALREAEPDAHIALLTSTHSAPIVQGTGLVNELILFDKQSFSGTRALLNPGNLRKLFALRKGRYGTIVFFHHFTLRAGTFKFALMALCAGSPRRIGLDNGNGWFLTESVPDGGFGTKHQAQYWLDLVALLDANPRPRRAVIGISEADRQWLETAGLSPLSNKPRVVIHAGSGGYSLARRWDADGFAEVANRLYDQCGAQIVLVGSSNDETAVMKTALRVEHLDLSGQTTLNQLGALLESADLFIGADSGVMHMACAARIPVVAIFGPSNAVAWGPWTPETPSVIVRSAPECSPCSYVGHSIGLRDGCPARTCMKMVTVDTVYRAAKTLLNGEIPVGARHALPLQPNTSPSTWTKRIHILGLPVSVITYDQWLDLIGNWVGAVPGRLHHVCTINPEFMMIAQEDINFRNILRRCDLTVPDGVGLLWAAKHLGMPLPERVTGSDGVPKIAERAAQTGWKLFLLGGAPGVAEKTSEILRERYPGVKIVGIYSGSPAPEEEAGIVEQVNASDADILFVAYGAPEQDKWIARNTPRLRVRMAMGVGGVFDFIAGILPRAPLWMQQMGLEWLYRLYLQPWRIRRMMRLPRFVIAVLLRGKR